MSYLKKTTILLSFAVMLLGACDGDTKDDTDDTKTDSGSGPQQMDMDAGSNNMNPVTDAGMTDMGMADSVTDAGLDNMNPGDTTPTVNYSLSTTVTLTDAHLVDLNTTVSEVRQLNTDIDTANTAACESLLVDYNNDIEMCGADATHRVAPADSCDEGVTINQELVDCASHYAEQEALEICVNNQWTGNVAVTLESCEYKGPDFISLNVTKCGEAEAHINSVYTDCENDNPVQMHCDQVALSPVDMADCRPQFDYFSQASCVTENGVNKVTFPTMSASDSCVRYTLGD